MIETLSIVEENITLINSAEFIRYPHGKKITLTYSSLYLYINKTMKLLANKTETIY